MATLTAIAAMTLRVAMGLLLLLLLFLIGLNLTLDGMQCARCASLPSWSRLSSSSSSARSA